MNPVHEKIEVISPKQGSRSGAERRHRRRISVSLPTRLRPAAIHTGSFEEVRLTENVCRGGLYIISRQRGYYKGMCVWVISPYSVDDSVISEQAGEIVRVDRLEKGFVGIAIRLADRSGTWPGSHSLVFSRY
jgi:hypothetical protein